MKKKTIQLSQLQPAPYNPRQITPTELQKLENNLQQFGLVDPIIINLRNNHIIGGHQRYTALTSNLEPGEDPTYTLLELGDIGWVFQDKDLKVKDDNHEKALNLSLNRISGEWSDSLGMILQELSNDNFDLDLTGFDDYEAIELTLATDDYSYTLQTEEDDDEYEEPVVLQDEETYITLQFGTPEQRTEFVSLIAQLKQENHSDQTITELLLNFLEDKVRTDTPKVQPYTLLFKNNEEKTRWDNLIEQINTNKLYKQNKITTLLETL